MDSFFGNIVKAKFNNREHQIKQSLIDTLSDNAKEIQYELKEGANDDLCGMCGNGITFHHFQFGSITFSFSIVLHNLFS